MGHTRLNCLRLTCEFSIAPPWPPRRARSLFARVLVAPCSRALSFLMTSPKSRERDQESRSSLSTRRPYSRTRPSTSASSRALWRRATTWTTRYTSIPTASRSTVRALAQSALVPGGLPCASCPPSAPSGRAQGQVPAGQGPQMTKQSARSHCYHSDLPAGPKPVDTAR